MPALCPPRATTAPRRRASSARAARPTDSMPSSLSRRMTRALALLLATLSAPLAAQELQPVTPPEYRGQIDAERSGLHDANRVRTVFYNYGMVGDFQGSPDLSVFHSVEVPKGIGLNYSDGVTPYVLARVTQENGTQAYIMLTGYRERQARSPITDRIMRFEPRPGYFEPDPAINAGRSVAISNDPRTWPGAVDASGNPRDASPSECWYDKRNDADDPGWCGSWNGFFGKRPNADQESFFVMDDNFYDAFAFYPDSRDRTRRGLGLRVEVRGFQWANPQAQNVIFYHYDIVNEGTTTYDDIIFGLYMDSGVGGSGISCDGVAESDDDNARFIRDPRFALVYTWDENGNGVSLRSNCEPTGYLGYAYLETPGDATDGIDNDADGITDEQRDGGPGERVEGQDAILARMQALGYDLAAFEAEYGALEDRPAFRAEVWWTGDEDLDWVAEFNDTGADGVFADDDLFGDGGPPDAGENDGQPTAGEPNFDQTDITESDQIGLTGFKLNRIAGAGETDGVIFFQNEREWPERLFEQFSSDDPNVAFDPTIVNNYNVGFLFASGPFTLTAGRRERFSLAMAHGSDLPDLQDNVDVVSSIYDANYRFATPPPLPTVQAFAEDGRVTLVWDDRAERSIDPVTNENDFEGYRIYRSTDANFLDPQIIVDAQGRGPIGNGRPVAQYDLVNDVDGFSDLAVGGVQYYLGGNTGLTHTYTDTDVVNGKTYYYAVTSYDRGSEAFNFYPSENAITVSRTLRGGTILPSNVAQVRPNAQVPGYVGATVQDVKQVAGAPGDSVSVRVLNSSAVLEDNTYRITFTGSADSVRAEGYTLTNLTTGEVLFERGGDLDGAGSGPVAQGVQPVVITPRTISIDTTATGFTPESDTGIELSVAYQRSIPINLRRPGFPEDLVITFADTPLDTSRAAIGQPVTPAKFKIVGASSGRQFDFFFRDTDGDQTLSANGEVLDVVAPIAEGSTTQRPLWRFIVTGGSGAPGAGDVYRLGLTVPFRAGDAFEFTTRAAYVDSEMAASAFADQEPYVVPNPYVAAASFEPERFATAGRGPRRIEFRGIPAGATVRIYTVRGHLVQTLTHDGMTTGMVPWDLRTKDRLEVAPGLYIFQVDAGDVGQHVGKFAIIK